MTAIASIISNFNSKKLLAGPVASTALLTGGQITGWQWVAVNLGYVVIQGTIDAVKEAVAPKVIDQQDQDIPKPTN